MTLTAADVVRQYLDTRKAGRGDFAAIDGIIIAATHEIVDELPDGFRKRDVTNCVKAMTAETPELADVKSYRRTLVASRELKKMVEDKKLTEEDGTYAHVSF